MVKVALAPILAQGVKLHEHRPFLFNYFCSINNLKKKSLLLLSLYLFSRFSFPLPRVQTHIHLSDHTFCLLITEQLTRSLMHATPPPPAAFKSYGHTIIHTPYTIVPFPINFVKLLVVCS